MHFLFSYQNGTCGVLSSSVHSWRPSFRARPTMKRPTMVDPNSLKCLWLCGSVQWLWRSTRSCWEEICENLRENLINFISLTSLHCSSFFQSVCVLGYCLTPLAVSLIICRMILVVTQTNFTFFLRLATSTAGFVWATYGESSMRWWICALFSRQLIVFNFQHRLSSWATVNRQIARRWRCIRSSCSTSLFRGWLSRTRTE